MVHSHQRLSIIRTFVLNAKSIGDSIKQLQEVRPQHLSFSCQNQHFLSSQKFRFSEMENLNLCHQSLSVVKTYTTCKHYKYIALAKNLPTLTKRNANLPTNHNQLYIPVLTVLFCFYHKSKNGFIFTFNCCIQHWQILELSPDGIQGGSASLDKNRIFW